LDSTDVRWGGAGAETPPEFASAGDVRFTLAPVAAAAYTLRVEPITHR
jgi:hypothetical protein